MQKLTITFNAGETDITDTLLEESVYPAKCGSQSGFSYPEFEYDVYYNPPVSATTSVDSQQ